MGRVTHYWAMQVGCLTRRRWFDSTLGRGIWMYNTLSDRRRLRWTTTDCELRRVSSWSTICGSIFGFSRFSNNSNFNDISENFLLKIFENEHLIIWLKNLILCWDLKFFYWHFECLPIAEKSLVDTLLLNFTFVKKRLSLKIT